MAHWQTISLKVNDEQKIHCSGCENSIRRALSGLPGVESVKADHRTQRIEVHLDSEQTALDELKVKLDWLGYTVTEK